MTKKDYILLAKAFSSAKAQGKGIDELIIDLSADLEADNPSFNPSRFKTACGIIQAN